MIRVYSKGGGAGGFKIGAEEVSINAPFNVKSGDVYYSYKEGFATPNLPPTTRDMLIVSPDRSIFVGNGGNNNWVKSGNGYEKYTGFIADSNYRQFSSNNKYLIVYKGDSYYNDDDETVYTQDIYIYYFDAVGKRIVQIFHRHDDVNTSYGEYKSISTPYIKWIEDKKQFIISGQVFTLHISIDESTATPTATYSTLEYVITGLNRSLFLSNIPENSNLMLFVQPNNNLNVVRLYTYNSMGSYSQIPISFSNGSFEANQVVRTVSYGVVSSDQQYIIICGKSNLVSTLQIFIYQLENGAYVCKQIIPLQSDNILLAMTLSSDDQDVFVCSGTQNRHCSITQIRKGLNNTFSVVTNHLLGIIISYQSSYNTNFVTTEDYITINSQSSLMLTEATFYKEGDGYIFKEDFEGISKINNHAIETSKDGKYIIVTHTNLSLTGEWCSIYKYSETTKKYSIKLDTSSISPDTNMTHSNVTFVHDSTSGYKIIANSLAYGAQWRVINIDVNDNVTSSTPTIPTSTSGSKFLKVLSDNTLVSANISNYVVFYSFNPSTLVFTNLGASKTYLTNSNEFLISDDETEMYVGQTTSSATIQKWKRDTDNSFVLDVNISTSVATGGFVLSKDKQVLLNISNATFQKYVRSGNTFVFSENINAPITNAVNIIGNDDLSELYVQFQNTATVFDNPDIKILKLNYKGIYEAINVKNIAPQYSTTIDISTFRIARFFDLDGKERILTSSLVYNLLNLYSNELKYSKEPVGDKTQNVFISKQDKPEGQGLEAYQIPIS